MAWWTTSWLRARSPVWSGPPQPEIPAEISATLCLGSPTLVVRRADGYERLWHRIKTPPRGGSDLGPSPGNVEAVAKAGHRRRPRGLAQCEPDNWVRP